MAQSSVPDGFSTTLPVGSGDDDADPIAQILQAELKPLGIKHEDPQAGPERRSSSNEQEYEYEMTFAYWTMDIADPDELVTFAVDPKSGAQSFFTDYNNPTVIKDTTRPQATIDTGQAAGAVQRQIQTQAAEDAFMAYLYYSPYRYATTTRCRLPRDPLGNYHMENVWLSK